MRRFVRKSDSRLGSHKYEDVKLSSQMLQL